MSYVLYSGDAVEWANNYSGQLFHAMLCDPPYHMSTMTRPRPDLAGYDNGNGNPYARKQARLPSTGFMSLDWDGGDIAYNPQTWESFKKVLLPGAFCMSFASSRGWHRVACAIEDAGFVFHPTVFVKLWLYTQGFPKATRIGTKAGGQPENWSGHRYGRQALKPAVEPILVFQKPYDKSPVMNIIDTGAGSINIKDSSIPGRIRYNPPAGNKPGGSSLNMSVVGMPDNVEGEVVDAWWPSNFASVDNPETGESFGMPMFLNADWSLDVQEKIGTDDHIIYCPKASRPERDAGLIASNDYSLGHSVYGDYPGTQEHGTNITNNIHLNRHPTVKPLKLLKWLSMLLIPPDTYAPRGIFIPFAGSGSEVCASIIAGWETIVGIELLEENMNIARLRAEYWSGKSAAVSPIQINLDI